MRFTTCSDVKFYATKLYKYYGGIPTYIYKYIEHVILWQYVTIHIELCTNKGVGGMYIENAKTTCFLFTKAVFSLASLLLTFAYAYKTSFFL